MDHSQTIGGNTAKLLGRYIPPPCFGTPGPVAQQIASSLLIKSLWSKLRGRNKLYLAKFCFFSSTMNTGKNRNLLCSYQRIFQREKMVK